MTVLMDCVHELCMKYIKNYYIISRNGKLLSVKFYEQIN